MGFGGSCCHHDYEDPDRRQKKNHEQVLVALSAFAWGRRVTGSLSVDPSDLGCGVHTVKVRHIAVISRLQFGDVEENAFYTH